MTHLTKHRPGKEASSPPFDQSSHHLFLLFTNPLFLHGLVAPSGCRSVPIPHSCLCMYASMRSDLIRIHLIYHTGFFTKYTYFPVNVYEEKGRSIERSRGALRGHESDEVCHSSFTYIWFQPPCSLTRRKPEMGGYQNMTLALMMYRLSVSSGSKKVMCHLRTSR